ncbi:MAG TPA: bacteriohopanetetrol glucosamine biosynthesis glycosyltransferase HpnI [Terriglobales bacterium]|nr:bacteriohopanetetrol glucosamine biosynthesis glycosyltransferase HpnI [Terriglobales bacterium]
MIHHLLKFLEVASVLGALAGAGYYLLCVGSALSFRRYWRLRRSLAKDEGHSQPPVSILKPLRGTDPDIYQSFRSHCLQDYPQYEVIFGVSDPHDLAAILVQRLMTEFPERAIKLVVCPQILGTNLKVSNLVQMLAYARYDHLIVNDSDIRLDRNYLNRVMAPLADPAVGMVTCMYRGIAGKTLGSRLESLGISTDFCAGVLAARTLEGIRFGLGSTLAFPRKALEAIGGFEPLVDYLSDDFELGARIAQAGYKVVLSDEIVDHYLPDYSVAGYIQHQMRWARGTRDSRRWGYAGMILTFGLPWALLALVISKFSWWAWGVLVLVLGMRLTVAAVVGLGVLRDRQLWRDFPLIPLRDLGALLVWIASFTGHTVAWRGDQFVLEKGKLRPA